MLSALKSVTWPEVALIAAGLGFTFAAYRYLGEGAAAAIGTATTLVALMLGRSKDGAQ